MAYDEGFDLRWACRRGGRVDDYVAPTAGLEGVDGTGFVAVEVAEGGGGGEALGV